MKNWDCEKGARVWRAVSDAKLSQVMIEVFELKHPPAPT